MDIFEKAKQLKSEIENQLPDAAEALEQFRIKYLGSKNVLKDLFNSIKEVPNERKKEFGQVVNELKQIAEEKFNSLKEKIGGEKNLLFKIILISPCPATRFGRAHAIR